MESAYWSMGWHAWVDNEPTCPFPLGTAAADDWQRGRDDARLLLTSTDKRVKE